VRVRADEVRPAASVLKVPLAAAAYAAAAAGELDLEQEVTRSELPESLYPSVLVAVAGGHRFRLGELCRLALITSDNASASHLLRLVGARRVNDWIAAQGCHKTCLEVGFSDEDLGKSARRNVSTAEESLKLVRLVATDERYADLGQALQNNLRSTRIPLRLPDRTPVRHKTGTLLGVVNDVGVIIGRRVDLAVAILSDGEMDGAKSSLEIGDFVGKVWGALGEEVAW